MNLNWDKLQLVSNGVLSTLANGTTSTAGGESIPTIGNSTTAILPITTPMANLGIPLTGSAAVKDVSLLH